MGEMMDKNKLDKYVKQSMLSIGEQAREIGMSGSCRYRKRKGISEFTVPKIAKCCRIFNIGNKEKVSLKKLMNPPTHL